MSDYWCNDSWRDSYDDWKLRSSDDEYDEPDECPHEFFQIDILTGRAECNSCDYRWWATPEEIAGEIAAIRRHEEWRAEQERPWNRLKRRWNGSRTRRWLVLTKAYQRYSKWRFNRRFPQDLIDDDDIPF